MTVPGALELPGAIALAARSGRFCAFVALGVVIRGETYHFEIVADESARGIMALTLQGYAIGNGILTVENEAQAIVRCDPGQPTRAAPPRGPRSPCSSCASNTRPSFVSRLDPAPASMRCGPVSRRESALTSRDPHRLAFPALLLGSIALAFGPWLVRLSDVGPVAAGFWRLALALPFLLVVARLAGQPVHWPRRTARR